MIEFLYIKENINKSKYYDFIFNLVSLVSIVYLVILINFIVMLRLFEVKLILKK